MVMKYGHHSWANLFWEMWFKVEWHMRQVSIKDGISTVALLNGRTMAGPGMALTCE